MSQNGLHSNKDGDVAVTPADKQELELQLAQLYAPIAQDLMEAERCLREELRSKVDFVEELVSRVQLYRGKRLRPALLLLTAKACGNLKADHHTLAAVVEMIHAATLVHDDVLDEASMRRHVLTVNAEWGNEASVLLGDFLFTHSFHLAASLESTLACRIIGRATNRVCEGELHQVARRRAFDLTEEEYFDIIDGKTAELIACSCRLGAHFAGASPEIEAAMTTYGRNLGLAFQITDDLLDLLGDESNTGKSIGTDLEKQKATLPLIRFREVGTPAAVQQCKEIFESGDANQREAILACLEGSDAIAYSRNQARSYAQSAADQLQLLADSPSKAVLATLAQFVLDRIA